MERRFAIFLVITLLIWLGFFGLQATFGPKRPKLPPPNPQAKAPAPAAGNPAAANPAGGNPAAGNPAPEIKPAPPAVVPEAPTVAHRRGYLGTLDPTSPYRMLVTWDNHGAVIERVELNSPRYRSVEDYTGYLGQLDLTDAKGGAVVQVVGPGTPAALAKPSAAGLPAGLQAADVIEQIDGKPVTDRRMIEDYLHEKTHPGQNIILTVRRSGQDKPLTLTAVLGRRPLEVVRPERHTYKTPDGGLKILPQDPLSLLLTLDNIGGRGVRAGDEEFTELPSLYHSNWTIDGEGPDFVEFSFTLDESLLSKINKTGALKVVKRYELVKSDKAEPGYDLKLHVAIHNQGKQPLAVGYRLDGPTGLPTEGWWYSTKLHPSFGPGAGARDVAWSQSPGTHNLKGCPAIVSETKTKLKNLESPLLPLLTGDQVSQMVYIGVDTQFFASALLPQPKGDKQPIKFRAAYAQAVQDVTPIPKTALRTADVSFRLATSSEEVPAGGSLAHDYHVFFGPKDPAVLGSYGLEPMIEYGWPIFKWPAWLLQKLLNAIYSVTHNYGIAIILLTVLVRSCMIPISLKQARTAAKMQELAPEVQKIKDRFPDDPMKQHTEVQKLYKEHNFNMFGGCLPVFLQLPIFIGLYRCLSVNIELRDAPLFPGLAWASNLAGPDKLYYWKDWMPAFLSDEADGYLGPFFNVLPLITVALFLVQQKMITPPATDEQTKMQQQMMTFMTVIMGVMFYKVPAGLCLYFITSSLWGICERKLLPKSQLKKAGGSSESSGGGGILAKLTPKPAPPNGADRDRSDRERDREALKDKLAKRAKQKR